MATHFFQVVLTNLYKENKSLWWNCCTPCLSTF